MRALLLALLLLLGSACSNDSESPQAQIRARIAELVQAIESGEARQVEDWLSPDYSDQRHANRREALASLFLYTRRNRNIHLFTHEHDLEVGPELLQAELVIDVAMTARRVTEVRELRGLRADLYRFQIELRRASVDDQWTIQATQWRRSELANLLP